MPRTRSIPDPIKLRVHVSPELHHQIIRLCSRESILKKRIVSMGEMTRKLLDKAVDRELGETVGR